ncbi:recombinase family protein [Streptomyces mirabilis]|uniref:recombinase family protein n=1 Tax=Streptomyces mirabilis TaxID=68239 RepID=UPI0036AF8829
MWAIVHTATATGNGQAIIEEEAEIVREVFRRYLDGESPLGIAQDLAARGVTTSKGKTWQPENVRHLLSSNFVAGVRIHQGEEAGTGPWAAITDRPVGRGSAVQGVPGRAIQGQAEAPHPVLRAARSSDMRVRSPHGWHEHRPVRQLPMHSRRRR